MMKREHSMTPVQEQRLLAETFLQHVCWMEEAGSTNSVAMEQASRNLPLPALFGADLQRCGRGRNQHTWWADAGALTFSLLISPETFGIRPSLWPLLSLATGLSVSRLLEKVVPDSPVQIKWPNDVYVHGKKVCGILLETVPKQPWLLVVGIGLNANNSLKTAPAELQQTATALCDVSPASFDRTDLLVEALHLFASELAALSQDSSQLIQGCRERCYLTGRLLTVRHVATSLTGMCLGIDDDGALRLMTESGPQRLLTGEITRID